MEVVFSTSLPQWISQYNSSFKNGMFHIPDGSGQSGAEADSFWVDLISFFGYSVVPCMAGSVGAEVKTMGYVGRREEVGMESTECCFKKFLCEVLGDEISRVLFKLGETCSLFYLFIYFNLGKYLAPKYRLRIVEVKVTVRRTHEGNMAENETWGKEVPKQGWANDAAKTTRACGKGILLLNTPMRWKTSPDTVSGTEVGNGIRMVAPASLLATAMSRWPSQRKRQKIYDINSGSLELGLGVETGMDQGPVG